jgi:hypothetical protein
MTITKPVAILLSLVGCAIVTLCLYVLGGLDERYMTSNLMIAVIAVLIGWSARKILTNETPWYSPHTMVLISLFAYYVIGSGALVYFKVPSHATNSMLSPEELEKGVLGTLVAVASYLLGFAMGPKKRPFLPDRLEWFFADTPAVQARFNLITMTLYGMGILAWFYLFAVGGGMQSHLQNIGSARGQAIADAGGIVFHISKFATAASLLYFSRNGLSLISIGMIGLLSFMFFVYGSRNLVGMYLIAVVIVYRFRFGKIPIVFWPIALFALSFVFTFMRILRGTGGNIARARYYQQRINSTLEGRLELLFGDFIFVNNWADIIANMGARIPYQYGRTFSEFLFIIPTFVWPDQYKFVKTGGQIYMENLAPDRIGFTSLSNNMFLDFFINFGWWGLVIMTFLFGLFVRWFQTVMITHPHRRHQVAHIVFAAIVGTSFITMLKSGSGIALNWLYLGFPIFVVYLPNLQHLLNPPPLPGRSHDHAHARPAHA